MQHVESWPVPFCARCQECPNYMAFHMATPLGFFPFLKEPGAPSTQQLLHRQTRSLHTFSSKYFVELCVQFCMRLPLKMLCGKLIPHVDWYFSDRKWHRAWHGRRYNPDFSFFWLEMELRMIQLHAWFLITKWLLAPIIPLRSSILLFVLGVQTFFLPLCRFSLGAVATEPTQQLQQAQKGHKS